MSRLLYFDCFSGISGDMALGAMLDAGLPLDDLKGALGSLAVSGFEVSAARVLRAGVSSTRPTLPAPPAPHPPPPSHHHPHRHLPAIFNLIDQSALSAAGRDRAKAMFQRLAEVEAGIHQKPGGEGHLHGG